MASVGDNPIANGEADRLDRLEGAKNLARDIREVDASQGYVVGIVGPWGSGKTSIINLLREELATEPALISIDFNPWVFSGSDDLVHAFLREISAQFKNKGDQLEDIAKLIDTYGDLLTPVTLIPFVGDWFARLRGAARVYAELQEKRKGSVTTQRDKVAAGLAKLERPIVVVIDDIDRLESSEIRDIFKLVRLTASFPNIVYVLAFDRARVEEALTQSGFDGRAYLEKIVQLGIDVPAIPESVMVRQIGEALTQALDDLNIPERFNEDAWPDILMEIIRPLIRNMRDVRRFAAAVRSKARALDGQVDLADIMGMEAIRVFLPDVFAAMVDGRDGLTTASDGYGSRYENPALKEQVVKVVEVDAAHSDLMRAAIRRLFPAGLRHIDNNNYGSSWLDRWKRDRRVAHPDVFATYLEHATNENMRTFRLAEDAYAVLTDQAKLDELLKGYDLDKLEDVISALEAFQDEYPIDAVVPASIVLLNLLPTLPERPRGMWTFTDTRLVVSRVVLRLLRRIESPDQVMESVDRILLEVPSLSSRLEIIKLVGHVEGAGHKLVSDSDAKVLEQALFDQLRQADPDQLAEEQELLRLMYFPKHVEEDGAVIPADPHNPKLAKAVLLAARSVVRSQGMESRKVRHTTRLQWDVLVEIFGSEDNVRVALGNVRGLEGDDLREVIDLTEKYLSGWRPSQWGDD